jgi:hypothetical protein
MLKHETVDLAGFNSAVVLPFELRLKDFEIAMQDVYDFFFDVNTCFRRRDCRGLMTKSGQRSCRVYSPIC